MENMGELLYENLKDGAYALTYDNDLFTENLKFASAEFNKLHVRKIKLPDTRGNVVYLLSDTFENTLNMIKYKHFIVPTTYRRLYYPPIAYGHFMSRRYKINFTKDKKERSKMISSMTKLRAIQTRSITNNISDNIFFSTADLYNAFKPIMTKYSVSRNYNEFFKEFDNVLTSMTPSSAAGGEPVKRMMIIDASAFKFNVGERMAVNKTNPLFLIYLSFLRNKKYYESAIDMDMLIYSGNLFLKFNPSKLDKKNWVKFKMALFRIMNSNLDNYVDSLSEEDKDDLVATEDKITKAVTAKLDPYTSVLSTATKTTVEDIISNRVKQRIMVKDIIKKTTDEEVKAVAHDMGLPKKSSNLFMKSLDNVGASVLSMKDLDRFNAIHGTYHSLADKTGDYVDDEEDDDEEVDYDAIDANDDDIESSVHDALTDDEEIATQILDDIQENTIPLKNKKTSPVNSARDAKLREAQKKVVVKTETIEEILERDTTTVPLKVEDKSSVLHTSNENMKSIRFGNFDKTYIDELMMKDIVACFDMLKDKSSPFYITNIDIQDTSTPIDLKDTWTVSLTDEVKKRHTIKVDIPKFIDYRFMLIDGTKYIILKQNFYNPLVKDTPDTVIITTNYFKITVDRKGTKSLSSIERIFSLIKKTGDAKMFITGDSSRGNMKFISSLEYDEISRRLFKYESGKCTIYFSRDYIEENVEVPVGANGNEFFIGFENKNPIFIDEDTGLDRQGRTIVDIMVEHLPDNYKATYDTIKAPSQSMYAECKLAGQWLPVVCVLLVWLGISKMLNNMGINWKFHSGVKRVPKSTNTTKYIRFADGVLEYSSTMYAELILNGIAKLHPERLTFEAFETEEGYSEFLYSRWGNYKGISQLQNFYEFLMDPITIESCKKLSLPYTADGLLIHSIKLLCDNAFVSKADDRSYRTRSIEMIPAILYSLIAKQYAAYVSSGRRIPMTLNRRAVISTLLKEKTIDTYSTLNPVIEVSKMNTISTKGYKGSNSDHSYDEAKRSYDPTSIGKIAISTSAKQHWPIKTSRIAGTSC